MGNGKSKGYIPESGMTAAHFKSVQQIVQTQKVIGVVRLTNVKSTPLIQKGFPAKPLSIKAHTDSKTGIVTAVNQKEINAAYEANHYVVDADLVPRRRVEVRGKIVTEELRLDRPKWDLKPGQVIDPDQKLPLVGDYDIHGVFDAANPTPNLVLHSSDGKTVKNFESPIVKRFRNAVNAKLDQPRMLHGAQDQYEGFSGGAVVFHPDGTTELLPTEAHVEAFYKSVGRQTMKGAYPSPPRGMDAPRGITELRPGGPVKSRGSIVLPPSSAPNLLPEARGLKGVAGNQEIMAAVGVALEAGLVWLNDKVIERGVKDQLGTTYSKEVAEQLARGNGVLVVIHTQEWGMPDENGFRGRSLLGVSVQGGRTEKEATDKWQGESRLLPGPADGWQSRDDYQWIEPPK